MESRTSFGFERGILTTFQLDNFLEEYADDFEVPSGTNWTISEAQFFGQWANGVVLYESWTLCIYSDTTSLYDGTSPGVYSIWHG